MSALPASALAGLGESARILDAGGWFKPLSRATHVADLMPYETRRCRLSPEPFADEKFTRDTWLQIDFLARDLTLPYPDRFFDFVFCGHTIEDLADPAPLLSELRRVGGAGYFETPSRFSEQTVGQRDRMGTTQGYSHHHWIVETAGATKLELFHKLDSLHANRASRIPLRTYERRRGTPPYGDRCQMLWDGHFDYEIVRGKAARERAAEFAAGLGIRPLDRLLDAATRATRRIVFARRRTSPAAQAAWWQDMLRMSRPYSRIPL